MSQRQSKPSGPRHEGQRGRHRPTLKDIADEAGVSMALVSMILSGKPGPGAATSARVLEVADRLGYRTNRTASQLARRRTRSLGVLMTLGNPYHAELVEEIQSTAYARDYEVVLGGVTRAQNERRTIDTLADFSCEALILINPLMPSDELVEAIAGLPSVCVGRPIDLPDVDVVRAADADAMAWLVTHLVDRGHTRIAHVDGGERSLPALRRRGYESAMRERGLEPLVIPGGETERDGATAAARLGQHPDVTAVIAFNDLCAVGVMDYLDGVGIGVPDDISVTGFDDDPVSRLHRVSLTTIHPSTVEQARLAVTAVLERLDQGRTERVDHVVTTRLVPRGSTGAVRGVRSEIGTSDGRAL